jgi:ubiquinone/menaquinone biosynthesis C-methylase UbiE
MSDQVSTSELKATWESAAPGWAKWESEFSSDLGEVTDHLLDMAGVVVGMDLLDIACGAGSQTIQAATRVGDTGHVLACDISNEMLSFLRSNAENTGLKNIETYLSPAEELSGTGRQFDAAISRFGLMLFASPSAALGGVREVLKPGGRFAALVFTTPDKNPFQSEPMQILLRHGNKPAPKPGQPGLFALGADGVLESLLNDSGLEDIKTKDVTAPIRFRTADDALAFLQEAAGAYRAVIADLDDAAKAAAWAEVRDCLTKFEGANGFEAVIDLRIGSGRQPT